MALIKLLVAVLPRPHLLVFFMIVPQLFNSFRSVSLARPLSNRSSFLCMIKLPALHGVQIPQDSCLKNSEKFNNTFTRSRCLLKIINDPPQRISLRSGISSIDMRLNFSFMEIHSPEGPLTCI